MESLVRNLESENDLHLQLHGKYFCTLYDTTEKKLRQLTSVAAFMFTIVNNQSASMYETK